MSRFLLFSLILSSCLATVSSVWAQEPNVWLIADDETLPGTRLYDLFQDAQGFLWLGTDVGLLRFDGEKFQVYSHPRQSNPVLTRIQQDQQGRLWMHNFSGQIFFLENDSLHFFQPWEDTLGHEFEAMLLDHEDRLWLVGKKVKEPMYYDFQLEDWVTAVFQEGDTELDWMIEESPRRFFFSSNRGIWQMNKGLFEPFAFQHMPDDMTFSLTQTPLATYAFDRERIIPGIFVIEGEHSRKLELSNEAAIFAAGPTSIKGTKDGNQWVCTRAGLFGFTQTYESLFGGKALLKDHAISDFLEDKHGNLWIATVRSGLFMIPGLDIQQYTQENAQLPDDRVTALARGPGGSLLMGFQNGMGAKFHPQQKKITYFQSPSNREVPAITYDSSSQAVWLSVGTWLCQFGQNGSLLKSYGVRGAKDLMIYDSHLLRAYPFGADLTRLSPRFGSSPAMDEAFRNSYKENGTVKKFGQNLVLGKDRAWAASGDPSREIIWVGYEKDLAYYRAKEHGFIRAGEQEDVSIFARDLSLAGDGILWAGTQKQGVFGIKDQRVVYHLSQENGLLPTNNCQAIEAVGNVLWIGSDEGILRFFPRDSSLQIFNRKDGLPSNDVRDIRAVGDSIYVGTPRGLTVVPIATILATRPAPPIFLNGFIESGSIDSTLKPDSELSFQQNSLRFEFLGLAYRARNEFSYRYRMIGLDSAWVEVPASQRVVPYLSLAPGTYTFEVITFIRGGQQSVEPARLSFSISPPYWQTWWFWLLSGLAVATLVGLLFQARIRYLKRKNYIEQELRSAQLAALKSQMNPHFIFNSLNSIQDFILLNEKKQANAYLGKFADLMRLYLDMSNQRAVQLSDEIRTLRLYLDLEAVRFSDKLTSLIEIDAALDPAAITIPAMVIQPYVENALKHGLLHKKYDRRLNIFFEMREEGEVLYCEIRDNGIGRKRSAEIRERNPIKQKSFATDATAKRLSLLNYGRKAAIGVEIIDLYDEAGLSTGTQVNIRIPLIHLSSSTP